MNNAPVFSVKHGFSEMDFDRVTEMPRNAFWSPGIGKPEVLQGARNSALLVGAFTPDGRQIGYARAISDKTRFAYIMEIRHQRPER
jgi:hypothetical protein